MEYYTPEQAAQAMGITTRALRKRIQRGDVRAVRLSERVLLIPEAEVARLRGTGKFKPGRKPMTNKEPS
jgi:excisionase family DNA binding protein